MGRYATDHHDELGATFIEYAFLVALIAIVCLTAVAFLGGETSSNLSRSGSSIFP